MRDRQTDSVKLNAPPCLKAGAFKNKFSIDFIEISIILGFDKAFFNMLF